MRFLAVCRNFAEVNRNGILFHIFFCGCKAERFNGIGYWLYLVHSK